MTEPYRGIAVKNYVVNRSTGVPEVVRQRFSGHPPLVLACVMWLGAHEDDVYVTEYRDGIVEVRWHSPYTRHELIVRERGFIDACRMAQQRELEDENRHGTSSTRKDGHRLGTVQRPDSRRLPMLPPGAEGLPLHGRQAEVLEPPGQDRHRPQASAQPHNAPRDRSNAIGSMQGPAAYDALVDSFVDEVYSRVWHERQVYDDDATQLLPHLFDERDASAQCRRLLTLYHIRDQAKLMLASVSDHSAAGEEQFSISATAILVAIMAWEQGRL